MSFRRDQSPDVLLADFPAPQRPAQRIERPQQPPNFVSLQELLDYDVEAYVESRIDRYEASKARWEECTMKEWLAGFDG